MNRICVFLVALLATTTAWASSPVNINTADAATLAQSLDGVGLSKAEAIVAWRTTNGAFESADQLTMVKGIGQSLVDRNRDAIRLGDASKPLTKARAGKRPPAADAEH
ncbi:competence protein ComEA [Luteibacter sp. Sphag1AF]|uniref:ComEA family DNA-binding protein n=1 Tax=Luteibacter sp. Sphag1AF TaxID=2587031 RepID=UPI00161A35E0|nr:helix-hairpin-helix domain-containing protein [Luteibacter sp. Sphag1AF]MBB3228919.1 competence protein ComEA [Luteibacter sp. Sphag1AF]